MTLTGARIAASAIESRRSTISIQKGRVRFDRHANNAPEVDLSGFLILPGLINAHDHLEFNLFPRLGRGPYADATEWAEDIYRPNESPVREHLQVPKAQRLFWGGIKNLTSGVTSVLHHNPYDASVFDRDFPVRVIQRFGWAHSLRFGGDIVQAWTETPAGAPFVIHACEGVHAPAAREIDRLDAAGVLRSGTVIVHGVALDENGAAVMKQRGVSLVWCPSSNHFTLGRTVAKGVLNSGIAVALGTDSALTGVGDLIDEIAFASREVAVERLYGMVTERAAGILNLTKGEGSICEGGIADLLVVEDCDRSPAASLIGLRPQLVLLEGRIKLISTALAERFPAVLSRGLQPLEIPGRGRWLIDCDIAGLMKTVRPVLGESFRLAGKGVAA